MQHYADNTEELKNVNESFFNALRKLSIIVPCESDYVFYYNALLNRRISVFRDSHYRLTINPPLNCNVSCWYCYETHTKHRMERPIQNNILKFIERTVSRPDITSLELDWFGGEPLLCYANIVFPGFTISAKVLSILRLQPGAPRVADGK